MEINLNNPERTNTKEKMFYKENFFSLSEELSPEKLNQIIESMRQQKIPEENIEAFNKKMIELRENLEQLIILSETEQRGIQRVINKTGDYISQAMRAILLRDHPKLAKKLVLGTLSLISLGSLLKVTHNLLTPEASAEQVNTNIESNTDLKVEAENKYMQEEMKEINIEQLRLKSLLENASLANARDILGNLTQIQNKSLSAPAEDISISSEQAKANLQQLIEKYNQQIDILQDKLVHYPSDVLDKVFKFREQDPAMQANNVFVEYQDDKTWREAVNKIQKIDTLLAQIEIAYALTENPATVGKIMLDVITEDIQLLLNKILDSDNPVKHIIGQEEWENLFGKINTKTTNNQFMDIMLKLAGQEKKINYDDSPESFSQTNLSQIVFDFFYISSNPAVGVVKLHVQNTDNFCITIANKLKIVNTQDKEK